MQRVANAFTHPFVRFKGNEFKRSQGRTTRTLHLDVANRRKQRLANHAAVTRMLFQRLAGRRFRRLQGGRHTTRRLVLLSARSSLAGTSGKRVGVSAARMATAGVHTANNLMAARFGARRLVTRCYMQPSRRVAKGNDAAKHGNEQRAKQHRSETISCSETQIQL